LNGVKLPHQEWEAHHQDREVQDQEDRQQEHHLWVTWVLRHHLRKTLPVKVLR
jgi:hypothetical protein